MRKIFTLTILAVLALSSTVKGQGFDSTQIGKDYPYLLPLLGKKAYKKGYVLPKPFGVMLNTLYTKQDLVLENFELAFVGPNETFNESDLLDLSDIIDFGPANASVLTVNGRADAWLLPFLSVGGYIGYFNGKTNITLEKPFPLESATENYGRYWGFNVLAVAPVGPVNISVDYSWSWSDNNFLSKPVLVNVAGLRVVKNFPLKKKDRFVGVWAGTQFQKLDAKTEGSINLKDALNIDESFQNELDTWYDGLTDRQKEIYGDKLYEGINNFANSDVHYRFDKRLKYNFNFILGGQYQLNREWQFRTEAGFMRSKFQGMLSANYRFGF